MNIVCPLAKVNLTIQTIHVPLFKFLPNTAVTTIGEMYPFIPKGLGVDTHSATKSGSLLTHKFFRLL